jgi:hypothetical protein
VTPVTSSAMDAGPGLSAPTCLSDELARMATRPEDKVFFAALLKELDIKLE